MGLFRHKGHHGGRYDDPHGVTAPKSAPANVPPGHVVLSSGKVSRAPWPSKTPEKVAKPVGQPEKIQIGTTPDPERPPLSKKEQRRKDKAMKDINKPKNREKARQGAAIYERAKADEDRRLGAKPLRFGLPTSSPDGQKPKVKGGVAEAYVKGGQKGVAEYDRKKFGKKGVPGGDTTNHYYKQKYSDVEIHNEEMDPFR